MDDTMSTAEYLAKWTGENAETYKQMLAKPTDMGKQELYVAYKGCAFRIEALAIVDGKSQVTIRPCDAVLRRQGPQAASYRKINTRTVPGDQTVWLGNPPQAKNWR